MLLDELSQYWLQWQCQLGKDFFHHLLSLLLEQPQLNLTVGRYVLYSDSRMPISVCKATKISKHRLRFLVSWNLFRTWLSRSFLFVSNISTVLQVFKLDKTLHKIHDFPYLGVFYDFLHCGLSEIHNLKYIRLQMLLQIHLAFQFCFRRAHRLLNDVD